jgi:hypothetical protein
MSRKVIKEGSKVTQTWVNEHTSPQEIGGGIFKIWCQNEPNSTL